MKNQNLFELAIARYKAKNNIDINGFKDLFEAAEREPVSAPRIEYDRTYIPEQEEVFYEQQNAK